MDTVTIGRVRIVESAYAKRAVEIGRKNRKTFRVLSGTGMIDSIQYDNGWRLVPFEMETAHIPSEALRRAELLESQGMVIGKIVAHDPPLVQMASPEERQARRTKAIAVGTAIAIGSAVVGVIGLAMAAPVVAVAAAPTAMSGASLVMVLAPLALIDPALICVLRDGTWVECCTWHEGYE